MRSLRTILAVGGLATVGAALWWRKNPSACPYGQRFWVEAPHPFITRKRLLDALDLDPGDRVLEVAAAVPQGQVDIFDIQQQMLDHVMREANRRGVMNVAPSLGDAQRLPYGDEVFDAAVLVTVLGEIPDQEQALRETARVLKPEGLREIARVLRPGGRLIVGELFGDPHMVTAGKLRERAGRAGLGFERRIGSPLAFFARFQTPPTQPTV